MEELLKAYARKRRSDAGAPFEMPFETKQRLQEEIARLYPQKTKRPPRRGFLEFPWPRIFVYGGATAVFLLSAAVYFTGNFSSPLRELRSDNPRLTPALTARDKSDVVRHAEGTRLGIRTQDSPISEAAAAGREVEEFRAAKLAEDLTIDQKEAAFRSEKKGKAARSISTLSVAEKDRSIALSDETKTLVTSPPAAATPAKMAERYGLALGPNAAPMNGAPASRGGVSGGFGGGGLGGGSTDGAIVANGTAASAASTTPSPNPAGADGKIAAFSVTGTAVPLDEFAKKQLAKGERTKLATKRELLFNFQNQTVTSTISESAPGQISKRLPLIAAQDNAARNLMFSNQASEPASPKAGIQAVLRQNVNLPAAANVLDSFYLRQQGPRVEIVDADGSVYSGAIFAADAPADDSLKRKVADKEKLMELGQRTLNESPARSEKAAKPSSQNRYLFRASGTNRSLNQFVLIEANLQTATNSVAAQGQGAAINSNAIAKGVQAAARVEGQAWIGKTNQLKIDAIEQAQPGLATPPK